MRSHFASVPCGPLAPLPDRPVGVRRPPAHPRLRRAQIVPSAPQGFSPEEDQAIMEAVAEHGTKWAVIVQRLPGRTDNAIKNRWNSTTRKMVRVQRRSGGLIPGLGDVDLVTMDAAAIAKHLLAHGVGLSAGQDFGTTTGFARLNLACTRATLERGLERICEALGEPASE